MDTTVFSGTIPALLTPCTSDREPDFVALVRKGKEMIDSGMSAVVCCGSCGDWPLLTDAERMEGVCGAVGAITSIGTIFPHETLLQVALSRRAAAGDPEADPRARELAEAFQVLAKFDQGVDLVLYFKHLMVLKGHEEYRLNLNESDALSPSQAHVREAQFRRFNACFEAWSKQGGVIAECM